MARNEFLNNLFDAHTRDLNDVYPEQGDIVVCPICLEIFTREAINEGGLTDGHVWPQYFRKNSEEAKDMHVLLCRGVIIVRELMLIVICNLKNKLGMAKIIGNGLEVDIFN